MKVWVHKNILRQHIKSLPFKAWVNKFNVWVPGEVQCGFPLVQSEVNVRFRPFEGYGTTEARIPVDAIHVDATFAKGLIRGGLPLGIYSDVKDALKQGTTLHLVKGGH